MGKEFMRDEKKPPNGVNGVAFPFLSSLICLDLIQVREGMDAFCLFAHMLQLFSIIPGFGCGYFNFGMFPQNGINANQNKTQKSLAKMNNKEKCFKLKQNALDLDIKWQIFWQERVRRLVAVSRVEFHTQFLRKYFISQVLNAKCSNILKLKIQ